LTENLVTTDPNLQPAAKSRFSESWREWLKIGAPIIILTGLAFAVAWHFVEPAPPKRVVIATGSPSLMYYKFGSDYAKYFKDNGIELVVKPTHGSVENYKLLSLPDGDADSVDAAIVQSGVAPKPEEHEGLQAVAGIYFEPVMVFYRGPTELTKETRITRIAQLAGKKIAIGAEGSGVRPVALTLLTDAGIAKNAETLFSDLGGDKAADALAKSDIDAAFYVNAPDADVVKRLLTTPGVHLMSFEHAKAYGRRFSYLSPTTLYRGSVSAADDLPHEDVQLVAGPATIVVRHSTHEAIIQLLVGAAQKYNSGLTLLSEPGTFPSSDRSELPVNKDAHYFLTNKPSILHRIFPFQLASMIDRLLILLLPFLVVLVPLVRMMPPLYRWRVRSRIYRWYKRVRRIDEGLNEQSTPAAIEAGRKDLAGVEKEVQTIKVPLSYTEELFNLRIHVGYVRTRIDGLLKVAMGR
jgi:TRAP transporter TAXI family solute receptor